MHGTGALVASGPSGAGASGLFLLGHDPLGPPGLSPRHWDHSLRNAEMPENTLISVHTLGSGRHRQTP